MNAEQGAELDPGLFADQLTAWTFEALDSRGRVDHHLWSMRTMPGGVPALTNSMVRAMLDLPGVAIIIDGREAWRGLPIQLPDLRTLNQNGRKDDYLAAEHRPDPDAARDDVLDAFDAGLGGGL